VSKTWSRKRKVEPQQVELEPGALAHGSKMALLLIARAALRGVFFYLSAG
jgi:hypothetical protein